MSGMEKERKETGHPVKSSAFSPSADGFGSDLMDRSNRKFIEVSSIQTDNTDPSYRDALQIIRLSSEKFNLRKIQEEETDKKTVELSRSLTALRRVAGALPAGYYNMMPISSDPVVIQAIQDFVAGLQDSLPNTANLKALCQMISEADNQDVRIALERVCAHESVRLILAGGKGRLK